MRYLLSIVFLLFCINSHAQLRLGLAEARTILQAKHVTVRQNELKQKIARIDLDQAYDALIPNLTFNMNNQHTMGLNFDQVTGQLITGNDWSNTANATVSSGVIVFQGLKGLYNIKAAQLNVDLAQLDAERLKHELELQLLSLFFQTLINADLHRASVEQAKLSGQQLVQEEIKIEVGKSTILDVAQARNKLASDQLNIHNAKNAYDLSMLKLKQLLEIPTDSLVELIVPSQTVNPTITAQYPLLDITQHPYIKQVDKRIAYSQVQTKLAKASYYPTLSVNTGYGTNYSSRRSVSAFSSRSMPLLDQMNQNRSLYVGLALSYTIFDRFNTKANVKKSLINTDNLRLEKEKLTRDRVHVFEQAKLEYSASLEE